MTTDEEIKHWSKVIREASKRLEQLFIQREIEREKLNGQLNIDDYLKE
ncbi:MAG: hypothetical protein GY793_01905 [Proteobacteria bacterium]|nr:hypothetical protein [Pseudomonadota bacterium]